jgi:hypothetical protein
MESEKEKYFDTPANVSMYEIEEFVHRYKLWNIRIFEEYLKINCEEIKYWKEYLINRNEELEETQQRS